MFLPLTKPVDNLRESVVEDKKDVPKAENRKKRYTEKSILTEADLKDGVIKLSLGKKRHVLIKPV